MKFYEDSIIDKDEKLGAYKRTQPNLFYLDAGVRINSVAAVLSIFFTLVLNEELF